MLLWYESAVKRAAQTFTLQELGTSLFRVTKRADVYRVSSPGVRQTAANSALAGSGAAVVALTLRSACADLKVGASAPESAHDQRGESPLRVDVTRNQPATASW